MTEVRIKSTVSVKPIKPSPKKCSRTHFYSAVSGPKVSERRVSSHFKKSIKSYPGVVKWKVVPGGIDVHR